MSHVKPYTLFLLCLCLTSCISATPSRKNLGIDVHVIFEVCSVSRGVSEKFDLGYQTVTNLGYGGMWLAPDKYSALGEPIFYGYASTPSETIAIVVRYSDAKNMKYVYMAPSKYKLAYGTWSGWTAANFISTDEDAEGKILRKSDLAKSPPEDSSPLIRFKLLKFNEYLGTARKKFDPPAFLETENCKP